MDLLTFLTTWLLATSAMTIFSYAIYAITKNEVREPVLLAKLLKGSTPERNSRSPEIILGWIGHYSIGIIFLLLYEATWLIAGLERDFIYGLIFGIVAGVLGVIGWIVLFTISSEPPKIRYSLFFSQLIAAHIVFSLTAVWAANCIPII